MMKIRNGAFLGFGAFLLVAFSGCDSEEYDFDEFDDPEISQEYRGADDPPPCGLSPDYNFKCSVDENDLGTWTPAGMVVPGGAQANLALWTTMSTSTVPQVVTDDCQSPPPSGGHSPVKEEKKGGVTHADVVVAKAGIPVYRAFSESPPPANQFGAWWALTPPNTMSKEDYQKSFAVCPEWNGLTKIVSCTLAKGSVVLVGPTQTAECADGSILGENSTSPQVFLNTYGRSQSEIDEFLQGCSSEDWSTTAQS